MVMDCKAAWQLGTISLPDALARGFGGVRSRHPSSAASAPTVVYLTTQHGVHGQAFLINIEGTLVALHFTLATCLMLMLLSTPSTSAHIKSSPT